jgi:hypothetical protein
LSPDPESGENYFGTSGEFYFGIDTVYDTIVELGVGGYIPSHKFGLVFNEIDASTFAKIMYATEYMLADFEGDATIDEANILPTINKYNFEAKRHFGQVEEIFRRHFGSQPLKL